MKSLKEGKRMSDIPYFFTTLFADVKHLMSKKKL